MPAIVADSAGSPEAAWTLIATPARWHEWAPHIRGAIGLGRTHVRAGARGVVLVGLWTPVPASITRVDSGREWSWSVGLLDVSHRIEPTCDGCRITIETTAPPPIVQATALVYGPVMGAVIRRLARLAAAAR